MSGWLQDKLSKEQAQGLCGLYSSLNSSIWGRGILRMLMLRENILSLLVWGSCLKDLRLLRDLYFEFLWARGKKGKPFMFISLLALHPFHSHFLIVIFIIFCTQPVPRSPKDPKETGCLFDKDRMSHTQWLGIFDRRALFSKASVDTPSPTQFCDSHRHLPIGSAAEGN